MIQPFFALAFAEVVATLILLFRTPLRNPLLMLLDKMKQGRGPIISQTVGATLFMILISILYNVTKIQKRSTDSGALNPTDEVLLVTHLLETCLLGFSLFLGLMIDRIHYYIKEIRVLRKSLDARKKSSHGMGSQDLENKGPVISRAPPRSFEGETYV